MESADQPLIEYPCAWAYRVIGRVEGTLRTAIAEIVPAERATVSASNASSGGRYVSLRVEIEVRTEVERVTYFEGLRDHPDTMYVL